MDNTEDETMARWIGFTEAERTRTPVLSELERKAYQIAWRLDQDRSPDYMNLASPSTRHARRIDHTARIIQEEMTR